MAIQIDFNNEQTGVSIPNAYARISEVHLYSRADGERSAKVHVEMFKDADARNSGKLPFQTSVFDTKDPQSIGRTIASFYETLSQDPALSPELSGGKV